ncbi:sigma-70 family RNA polymerase sigma factor [Heliobacterium undosum]|uniref:Sigma-70 family RNA polymerase sigma factor n=1 Tax=Heliomicrobium undosum TaxID=121734 RepID=A0A845L2Z5_9FIRM|nr:sigma-70 family RNA polymerase sigma factor [Heliomicrobium undosum]MZP28128.1 sigma-70 family RNA polymerase sigma factor [Heliomicrobium undosum]
MEEKWNDALIDRCRNGDREALGILLEGLQKPIYNLCYRLLNHREDARDAAQEVLIRICRSLSQFRGQSRFSTWAYRLATNHCIDRMRRNKPTALSLEQDPAGIRAAESTGPPDPAASAVIVRERAERVREAVASLPEHYRVVIALYHLDELSYSEIADVLNVPKKTVETRLYRAKSLLRESLRDLAEKGGDLL